MAFTTPVVTGSIASTDANSVASASFTSSGDLIIVNSASYEPLGAVTVTDNKGNTYTPLTGVSVSGVAYNLMHFCLNPVVGSGHVITLNCTNGAAPSGQFEVWDSAAESSVLDGEDGASASSSAVQPGPITPSVANCLVVTGLTFDVPVASIGIDSGFTKHDEEDHVAFQHFGTAMAYKVQTSATAEDPTWVTFTATTMISSIAVFKSGAPSGGGGGSSSKGAAAFYYAQQGKRK